MPYPKRVYLKEDSYGGFEKTEDLGDFADGDKVAVYELVKTGVVSTRYSVIEDKNEKPKRSKRSS